MRFMPDGQFFFAIAKSWLIGLSESLAELGKGFEEVCD